MARRKSAKKLTAGRSKRRTSPAKEASARLMKLARMLNVKPEQLRALHKRLGRLMEGRMFVDPPPQPITRRRRG